MRFFRRARDTRAAVARRESPSEAAPTCAEATPTGAGAASTCAEDDTPIAAPRSGITPAAEERRAMEAAPQLPSLEPPSSAPSLEADDSDVFVFDAKANGEPVRPLRQVTLFVHDWHNVEPGLLSWTFPSLRSALDAVQRMKNAIGWCVVSGTGWTDLDTARARGAVLVEQLS